MNPSADVARRLLEIQAVQLRPNNPFTWASGLLSPIYCDNRVALSYPHVRTLIKCALRECARQFEPFEAVVGVATAGIAPGVLLADLMELPFGYVRNSPKDHGRRNRIEGVLTPGQRALVVEDLISTGGSSLAAVEALREAQCAVVGVLAIFHYGFEKTKVAFQAQNLPLTTITDYATLLQEALKIGYIDEQGHQILEQWHQNPEGWGALYA